MTQNPQTGSFAVKWRGDTLHVELRTDPSRKGRAAFRTNIGNAAVRRAETIAETETGVAPMARAWTDIPMQESAPGEFSADVPLDETGVFSGKACFFPEGSEIPEWPEGPNMHVKVESASAKKENSIYTVFPRQFGSFREVARRLPLAMDTMGFRIIQTLPPFPVPATYAVMGEYGCPFASLDFKSVDPAMAEFDEKTTPLDQFMELVDAVHSRGGRFFIDLPANHTGWASTLQTHHPEWFRREADGRFASPGAWGVKWADLVELDYSRPELRSYMADVFLFWCAKGVDGFRCDAGYMIPLKTWEYIVARVRDEFPDTVFMLEGLGGSLETTDNLLKEANLDWAYSEIFQTHGRNAFEWYLPQAIARAESCGTLVHFAETHDNDRLAKGGETYARLRVALSALLSWQGAWGIANGVEWFCTEKIDVHGKNDLNWGAKRNMVDFISRLNAILASEASFSGAARLEICTRGGGDTLAVARWSGEAKTGPADVLVLANLDCSNGTEIDWDGSKFPHAEAFDLLTETKTDASGKITLPPGGVLCLVRKRKTARKEPAENPPASSTLFKWIYPRDARREFVAPEGETVEVSAPGLFRANLVDPESGKTLFAMIPGKGEKAHFTAPPYDGDGRFCRELKLDAVFYGKNGAERTSSKILVPPPPGKEKAILRLDGADVRSSPLGRTILSNGAGAASQMRTGWASIASQYDAILAANPSADHPSDRVNAWTRARCWLQREGYVREFDARSTTAFSADPAGRYAQWDFTVPCGMGKNAAFTFTVSLAEGENAARLAVARRDAGADDAGGSVRLVFRPDIEWRSFHSATKAYAGPETSFPAAVGHSAHGFTFSPSGGKFEMEIEGGEFHFEPEWNYNIAHPEEAERMQEPCGDLFSPGWISIDIVRGGTAFMSGRCSFGGAPLPEARFAPVPAETAGTLPLPDALRRAMDLFIVRRDGLKTVIAGYPWFLDWGRDTFIFMRGMIAAGMLDDSIRILEAFAAFEDRGTLPNIIYGAEAGNRDTSDAPLWFVRCVMEAERAGARAAKLRKTCESIVENYIAGTPNGIKADPDSALVFSPSHFTWMDTNYPACTPRQGYPVEIQALWISALEYLGRHSLAAKARKSVERLFKIPGGGYCDCLDAAPGDGAETAARDEAVRPNQLFLLTLGAVEDESIVDAVAGLLVPGGMRSLDAGDPLYKPRYTGDEDTSRKPAYHNGTAWAWTFPQFAEALAATGRISRRAALSVLASATENLNRGCVCHISEIADGDAPHAQKGCTAQAWSVSELLRVWLKLSRGEEA